MEIYPPSKTLSSSISADLLTFPGQPPIFSLSLDLERYPKASANFSNLRHQLRFPLWRVKSEIPQLYLSSHDQSHQLITCAIGESITYNPFDTEFLVCSHSLSEAAEKRSSPGSTPKPEHPEKEIIQVTQQAHWLAGIAVSQIERSLTLDAAVDGWARALSLRDDETSQHTQRVTELAARMGARMGFSEDQILAVERGAKLHDIGKMGIPDKVLLKPGPLNEDDWLIMQRHPTLAFEMLQPIPYIDQMLDIPYCHHERWDGNGYPRRLKANQIPIAARIFSVIDVWDALCSDRPYRKAWPKMNAVQYLKDHAGSQFDPCVVEIFLDLVMNYPG